MVLAGLAVILVLYGLWDGFSTGMVYFRGERGTGIVISRDEGSDDTRIRVGGEVCPVTGEQGNVGRPVPVAYRHGHPGECIVRRPAAFKWSALALLAGGAMIGVYIWRARAAAEGGSTSRPMNSTS